MYRIAKWEDKERAELFNESASRRGVVPAIIEKDFWVCWVLGKIFSHGDIRKKIMFKGGTSLSKVFGLIERFSEDIDLAIDWNEVVKDDPASVRSKSQQSKFNKKIRKEALSYIRESFLPKVKSILTPICTASIKEEDPNIICIKYPAAFSDAYLRSEVLLEIGPFAAWDPHAEFKIMPYVAEEFPENFMTSTSNVVAIKCERTFWEKATILHAEAHRPPEKPIPMRYSRHYYDMMRLANSRFKESALSDIKLLHTVVDFKMKYFPCGWAKYEFAKPGTLKLVPPQHVRESLEKDYKDMQIMIFGDIPKFDEIVIALEQLEKDINGV